jgi:hypothetical protein
MPRYPSSRRGLYLSRPRFGRLLWPWLLLQRLTPGSTSKNSDFDSKAFRRWSVFLQTNQTVSDRVNEPYSKATNQPSEELRQKPWHEYVNGLPAQSMCVMWSTGRLVLGIVSDGVGRLGPG